MRKLESIGEATVKDLAERDHLLYADRLREEKRQLLYSKTKRMQELSNPALL
jgi:hypothetical protein